MGSSTSKLRSEDVEELVEKTHFTPKQIKHLYKRFQRLDKTHKGRIGADELLSIPELCINPLVDRVVVMFDSGDEEGGITFAKFCEVLSVFSGTCPQEQKLRFVFDVYDVDRDGYISADDLTKTLKLLVADNLTQPMISAIVDRTIREVGGPEGRISLESFGQALKPNEVGAKMTLSF